VTRNYFPGTTIILHCLKITTFSTDKKTTVIMTIMMIMIIEFL